MMCGIQRIEAESRRGGGRHSQSRVDLEGVVDAPLQTGERSDHDNTQGQTASEQGNPALHTRIQWSGRRDACWK